MDAVVDIRSDQGLGRKFFQFLAAQREASTPTPPTPTPTPFSAHWYSVLFMSSANSSPGEPRLPLFFPRVPDACKDVAKAFFAAFTTESVFKEHGVRLSHHPFIALTVV